jgi:hypothetical protein
MISHPLARPRTIAYLECKTCGQTWIYSEIDTDGNGPCCHRVRPLNATERIGLDLERVKARIDTLTSENRLLRLANQSLSRVTSPEMLELLDAAQAWKVAIDPGKPDGVHAAEQRLIAAVEAVEESKQ